MRVALCLSGQPRNAEKTIESIKKNVLLSQIMQMCLFIRGSMKKI